MKYIYIDKKTRQIKMESQKRLELPQFEVAEIDDKEDLSGYSSYLIDNKISKTKIINGRQNIIAEIDKAKDINELKDILKELL